MPCRAVPCHAMPCQTCLYIFILSPSPTLSLVPPSFSFLYLSRALCHAVKQALVCSGRAHDGNTYVCMHASEWTESAIGILYTSEPAPCVVCKLLQCRSVACSLDHKKQRPNTRGIAVQCALCNLHVLHAEAVSGCYF